MTAPHGVSKVVVLGAGMMGAGIAYSCAQAGLEVVLTDVDQTAAERGRGHSERLVTRTVARGLCSQADGDALLQRITATADLRDATGADCVIEAVYEDADVKARAFFEIESHLAPDALLATNTSTLPVTGLAEHVTRPEAFIGLHFFSPVDRMPLLEVIRGARTSRETVDRALDFGRRINKIPILVNDSRGFYTSRVMISFLTEGLTMLAEGVTAAAIEQACVGAGYPVPVLQLSDELNMRLMQRVRDANRDAAPAEGRGWEPSPAEQVFDRMAGELDRPGRLDGRGFYDYVDGRRAGLWPGLDAAFGADAGAVTPADVRDRLLFVEAIEAVRCVEEGVIESVSDVNVGSILGIGFPAHTGGVLAYINGYAERAATPPRTGLQGFVARATELAQRYGARFAPPPSLVGRAERDEAYADPPDPPSG